MATADEVEQLNTLPVPQMEEQWLRLMIRHHPGAVPMADVAADRAASGDVALLAGKMSAGQSEIDALRDMLRQRGLAPEPGDAHPGHGG